MPKSVTFTCAGGVMQHVARLHVAVHDAVAVREHSASAISARDPAADLGASGGLGPDDVAQRPTLDVLHDDEVRAALLDLSAAAACHGADAAAVDGTDVLEHAPVARLHGTAVDEGATLRPQARGQLFQALRSLGRTFMALSFHGRVRGDSLENE